MSASWWLQGSKLSLEVYVLLTIDDSLFTTSVWSRLIREKLCLVSIWQKALSVCWCFTVARQPFPTPCLVLILFSSYIIRSILNFIVGLLLLLIYDPCNVTHFDVRICNQGIIYIFTFFKFGGYLAKWHNSFRSVLIQSIHPKNHFYQFWCLHLYQIFLLIFIIKNSGHLEKMVTIL